MKHLALCLNRVSIFPPAVFLTLQGDLEADAPRKMLICGQSSEFEGGNEPAVFPEASRVDVEEIEGEPEVFGRPERPPLYKTLNPRASHDLGCALHLQRYGSPG